MNVFSALSITINLETLKGKNDKLDIHILNYLKIKRQTGEILWHILNLIPVIKKLFTDK